MHKIDHRILTSSKSFTDDGFAELCLELVTLLTSSTVGSASESPLLYTSSPPSANRFANPRTPLDPEGLSFGGLSRFSSESVLGSRRDSSESACVSPCGSSFTFARPCQFPLER